jgi:alpha-beta hydrolase superfamily lysophospholipase
MKKHIIILSFLLVNLIAFSQSFKGDWRGELTINGFSLPIVFHVDSTATGWKSTMDSPKQGAKGIPCDITSVNNKSILIQIQKIRFTYKGNLTSNDAIQGELNQNNASFALNLQRSYEEIKTQTEQATISSAYASEEIKFTNPNGGHTLAGTFTFPKDGKAHKTVVLISGSGPQNRDEEIFDQKPFFTIADYLTKQGIAVLRFDDRGVGASTGDFASATTFDLATDVEAAVNFLKTRKEVAEIGLIGHSEGGVIAPILASKSNDIKFIVLLAGPGTSGKEVLIDQAKLISEVNKVPANEIEKSIAFNSKMYELISQRADTSILHSTFMNELKSLQGNSFKENEAELMYNQLTSSWFTTFITLEPSVYLSKVTCPVLALNGTKDLQVPCDKNLEAIKTIVTQNGNKNVTTIPLKNLNHLFQKSKTGSPAEYAELKEPFSPKALKIIGDWILAL